MIYVRTLRTPEYSNDPEFMFVLNNKDDILKFQEILNRALNCAPEFGIDWFNLSSKLDRFIESLEQ